MSTPAADISVCVGTKSACVKIRGRANFNCCLDFNALLTGLREKGYDYFLIELTECSLMDSSFLGVLAGFGLKMSPCETETTNGARVELHNPNARVTELLENVGVLRLFKISHGPLALPEELGDCEPQPAAQHSREEVTRACLEAHEKLMAINPENVARFKDVTKFLAEDLARLKGAKQ